MIFMHSCWTRMLRLRSGKSWRCWRNAGNCNLPPMPTVIQHITSTIRMPPIIWQFNELAGTTPFSGISWSRCVVDLLNEWRKGIKSVISIFYNHGIFNKHSTTNNSETETEMRFIFLFIWKKNLLHYDISHYLYKLVLGRREEKCSVTWPASSRAIAQKQQVIIYGLGEQV